MRNWFAAFPRETISFFSKGGGGVDIGPLPSGRLADDWILCWTASACSMHHSANDTFDSVNRRELELGTRHCRTDLFD